MADQYIIAGGTGFIGSKIVAQLLQLGHRVIVLTRSIRTSAHSQLKYIQWDPSRNYISETLPANSILICLAGEGINNKRWNTTFKQKILTSRQDVIHTLLNHTSYQYIAFASAIGFYKKNTDEIFTEDSAPSNGFLAETCKAWESAAKKASCPFSIHRIGLVIGNGGGMLQALHSAARTRIAGVPGHGRQVYSWVALEDVVAQLTYACIHKLEGIYNCVSPHVNSAEEVILAIQKNTATPYLKFYIPQWLLKIILGEFSIELTGSCNVSSKKIQSTGFIYQHTSLNKLISTLLLT